MTRRNILPPTSGLVAAVAAVLVAASFASGEDPFRITPLNSENLKAGGPIGALYSPGDSDTLHAGTYGAAMANFAFYLPDVFNDGTTLPPGESSLATLMLAGSGREFVAGGLSRLPKLVLLPGSYTGRVPIPDEGQGRILGIAVDPANRLVALRCERKVLVYKQVPDASTPLVIDGVFDHLALVHDSQEAWLAATSNKEATLRFWRAADLKEVHVVRLPPGCKLTRVAERTGRGWLVTGDSAGRLRSWNAVAASTSKALPKVADALAISPGAQAVALHAGKSIHYDVPFGGSPAKPAVAEPEPPTSIRVDDNGLVAVAWPKAASAFGVDLFNFADPEQPKRSKLVAQSNPTNDLRALALRADGAPQAAAFDTGSKRVILFFPQQPPDPPNNQGEDDAIVGLSYLPDTDGRIVAIGKGISLYRSDTGKLDEKVVPFKLKTADVVTACDVGPVGNDGLVRILLGTQGGRLELWKASLKTSPVTIERLASSEPTSQPLDRVALGEEKALSVAGEQAILWDLGTSPSGDSPIVAVEAFQEGEVMRAVALADDSQVTYCTSSLAIRTKVSALRQAACGDQSVKFLVADDASTTFIAADASGKLYKTDLSKSEPAASLSDAPADLTALALHGDGKVLLVALQEGGESTLQRRGGGSVVTETYKHKRAPITSLAFGDDDATIYTAEQNGRLTRLVVAGKAGATSLTQDLRLADAPVGNVTLVWRPDKGSAKHHVLLVLDVDGQLSLRATGTAATPAVRLAPDMPVTNPPAPWYAGAVAPDGKSIALVNAEGQVWFADWPFPPKVTGWTPDVSHEMILRPSAAGPPSKKPLYAAAWLGKPDSPSLVVAGADGSTYLASEAGWNQQSPTSSARPIYALASYGPKGSLIIGLGPRKSHTENEWLLVQNDPLHSSAPVSWSGHAGPIIALTFSPDRDQRILASVDATGRLKLWEMANLANTGLPRSSTVELAPSIPTSLAWLSPEVLAIGLQGGQVALFLIRSNP